MKRLSLVIGVLAALAAPSASAQSINLTGIYTCVDKCRGSLPAHVTQNGYDLNLLTEFRRACTRMARLVFAGEPDLD